MGLLARMFPFRTSSSRRWTGKMPLLSESLSGSRSSGNRARASPFMSVILPSRAPKAARAALRFAQFAAFFPLHRLVPRDDQLRDAITLLDRVIARAQVKHHHANLAAIPRVDGAEVRHNRMLQCHPAARPNLRLIA